MQKTVGVKMAAGVDSHTPSITTTLLIFGTQAWQTFSMDHTVLPATQTFIYELTEPYHPSPSQPKLVLNYRPPGGWKAELADDIFCSDTAILTVGTLYLQQSFLAPV